MNIKIYGDKSNCSLIDGCTIYVEEYVCRLEDISLMHTMDQGYRAYISKNGYIHIDKREYDKLAKKLLIEPSEVRIESEQGVVGAKNNIDGLEI